MGGAIHTVPSTSTFGGGNAKKGSDAQTKGVKNKTNLQKWM